MLWRGGQAADGAALLGKQSTLMVTGPLRSTLGKDGGLRERALMVTEGSNLKKGWWDERAREAAEGSRLGGDGGGTCGDPSKHTLLSRSCKPTPTSGITGRVHAHVGHPCAQSRLRRDKLLAEHRLALLHGKVPASGGPLQLQAAGTRSGRKESRLLVCVRRMSTRTSCCVCIA